MVQVMLTFALVCLNVPVPAFVLAALNDALDESGKLQPPRASVDRDLVRIERPSEVFITVGVVVIYLLSLVLLPPVTTLDLSRPAPHTG